MEYEKNSSKRAKTTIWILSIIVVILLLVLAFFFVVKPQINKFAYSKQVEGVNLLYAEILNNINANGYYSLPVGNETLILVPYVPQQQIVETQ